MMRKAGWLMLALATVVIVCGGCAKQSDVSGPKEWTFQLTKVWEIQQMGGEALLRPGEPRVGDDGTMYFRDFDQQLSYVVDTDGALVGTFAARGDEEGNVPMYINCFPAGDQVVIGAPDKLHFFTEEGDFVKSISNNLFVRFPLLFRNENEFWAAPGALGDAPEGTAAVTYVDAATGEEQTFYDFTLTDEEKKPSGGGVIVGLTPQAKMAIDRQSDRVYFGKNSDTVIHWSAADGTQRGSFSFTGSRRPVSEADKRQHFAKFNIPEDRISMMIAALPNQMAYYNGIQVVNGLVYLLGAGSIGSAMIGQDVNIYSPDGRHLYYGRIHLDDGWHVFGSLDNLQLADGFVYVVQENEAGDKRVVKYAVALPEA